MLVHIKFTRWTSLLESLTLKWGSRPHSAIPEARTWLWNCQVPVFRSLRHQRPTPSFHQQKRLKCGSNHKPPEEGAHQHNSEQWSNICVYQTLKIFQLEKQPEKCSKTNASFYRPLYAHIRRSQQRKTTDLFCNCQIIMLVSFQYYLALYCFSLLPGQPGNPPELWLFLVVSCWRYFPDPVCHSHHYQKWKASHQLWPLPSVWTHRTSWEGKRKKGFEKMKTIKTGKK